MSEVLPMRGIGLPLREHGSPRELPHYEDGPTPLRRPFNVRRRKKSGIASLLAAAALRAILVVALPVGIVVWLLYSPYFLIREVKVDGGARVSAAWMQENLAPLVGRHVLAVSLEGVRRRLSAHPWVASVELRRELPDRLRVSVVERQPVALLAAKDGLVFLDGEGLAIAPVPSAVAAEGAGRGRPLPLEGQGVGGSGVGHKAGEGVGRAVAVGFAHGGEAARASTLLVLRYRFPGPVPVQPALDVVAELRRAHPAWGVGAREVEILGEGEYRVTTAALPYPLLLEAGTVGAAVSNLQQMLPEIERRVPAVGEADLRSPRRLVIRPAPQKASTPSMS